MFYCQILLVLTDGIQTKERAFTPLAQASLSVKQKGVRVYAMGIGKSVAKDELEDIASNPNRDVFLSESFSALKPKVQEIIDKVCFPGE
jgi:predicted peroxiredoxin